MDPDHLAVDGGQGAHDATSVHTLESASDTAGQVGTPDRRPSFNGSVHELVSEVQTPATPLNASKTGSAQNPRLKKKVPWNGKNIMICLPRDDERGQHGRGSLPLTEVEITAMFRSWEELGYDTRGFDLDGPNQPLHPIENYSQSRSQWPNLEEMAKEHMARHFKVTLPDLRAWEDYVNELTEAKLRALGVSLGDDEPEPEPEPAPQSISPMLSNLSRGTPNPFPQLPFSPPLPTSSAASGGIPGFPFPNLLQGTSASQSPAVPSIASPVGFNPPLRPGKYNPRASISVSPHELPFHFSGQNSPAAWSPQSMLMQQQISRNGSPSILNLNSLVSSASPFSPDSVASAMNLHNRHQSLQYPMLPHQYLQRQESARASPRLQELREVDEEAESQPYASKSPSKTPEPASFMRHNASASLQKEIDDAEYHLEEQLREQLEHEDYNPQNDSGKPDASKPTEPTQVSDSLHARESSVRFGGLSTNSGEGPVLHHPQPHSRGHSLTQRPFFDQDEVRNSNDEATGLQHEEADGLHGAETFEIETNPSELGTPNQTFNLVNQLHQPTYSTASNPWADVESMNASKGSSRHPSHGSKHSLTKLNANATEFKFNPASTFTPGKFNFEAAPFQPAATTFQPAAFPATTTFTTEPPQSATSTQFSAASNVSSKGNISASAAAFSPGSSNFSFPPKSDFNFLASGPSFNPDAPTFQPGSLAQTSASGSSANSKANNRSDSIFGNIRLKLADVIKPAKKSKAIPIVRPPSRESPAPITAPAPAEDQTDDQDRRLPDESRRSKKFREDDNVDGDDVPKFAEPTPEPEPAVAPSTAKTEEDESANIADTTMASTVLSESTDGKLPSESNDTKATTSPSATSPDHEHADWPPFEFSKETDIQDFNDARPFGENEPPTKKGHKKGGLSATANSFYPGDFTFTAPNPVAAPFEPATVVQPPEVPSLHDSEDDGAASPTPGPEPRPAASEEAQSGRQSLAASPEPEPEPEPSQKTGLGASRFASPPPPAKAGLGASRFASPPRKVSGLADSRFAASPPSATDEVAEIAQLSDENSNKQPQLRSFNDSLPQPASPPSVTAAKAEEKDPTKHEPTFEEIDAVMRHMNKNDPTHGVHRTYESPAWHPQSPVQNAQFAGDASPLHLQPLSQLRSSNPSPSPRQYRPVPSKPASAMLSREFDDPFVDRPHSVISQTFDAEAPIHRLNGSGSPRSEWDAAFSEAEQDKLEERVHYFDGRVNDLVGNVLASRLEPLEKTLGSIQNAIALMSRRTPSSLRDRRSVSAEIQESDADDEDEEPPVAPRSTSPRKDKRLEQIRFAVLDALNQHQAAHAQQQQSADQSDQSTIADKSAILNALEEISEHIVSLQLDFGGDDLRNVVEEAIEHRVPAPDVLQGLVEEAIERRKLPDSVQHVVEESIQRQMLPLPQDLQNIIEEALERRMPPPPEDSLRNIVDEVLERRMPPPPGDALRHIVEEAIERQMLPLPQDLQNIVEEAIDRRMLPVSQDLQKIVGEAIEHHAPPVPQPVINDDEEATRRLLDMQSKVNDLQQRLEDENDRVQGENELRMRAEDRIAELEQRLRAGEDKLDMEATARRGTEDRAAELERQLQQAETRVEVEIMNRSVYDQRIHDLEERLKVQESKNEDELFGRRKAEDRLSEIQRLLRISSEEEDRLRALLEERDETIKEIQQAAAKSAMRLALLEDEQSHTNETQIDLRNRLNAQEEELRGARQETRHWRSEAEQARDSARRAADDLVEVLDEDKHLRKLIDTLGNQLEEQERIREGWRVKFISLQDDMAHAAREITEENVRRTKREQALIARHEVLDARLQAESRTRERLETELERLESGERAGLRAVAECKRLEGMLAELRTENEQFQQDVIRLKHECEDARAHGEAEVQHTRAAAAIELDELSKQASADRTDLEEEVLQLRTALKQANLDLNALKAEHEESLDESEQRHVELLQESKQRHEEELEEEVGKVRAELDQVRLDADTAKAHHDMMLEEAQDTKKSELEELQRKHQNEVEDMEARYERQLSNTTEDAQRTEQNLLERLSLAQSKTEHLQDRVAHLEERLEIAQEAARAAAQAAKSVGSTMPTAEIAVAAKPVISQPMPLPEKISPQALRESIMVLQEQLQAREQHIEELEQANAKLDPDAATKITKRDDEITWLRELLAVRHGDLQDIIAALSAENYDREAVKDASIRLKANLQMEEQERERAMNGGSAIHLPNIAATISAATPRVAQAVGPLAAAWGSWRKANQPRLSNISSVLSSPALSARSATPSKSNVTSNAQGGLLSGLMTPPTSGLRTTPPAPMQRSESQPTAFSSTGRRFTAEEFANRTRGVSLTARQVEKLPMAVTPPRPASSSRQPVTPPMVRSSGYDSDAQDFDDASGFFDD